MKKKARTILSMFLVAILTVTLVPQSFFGTLNVKMEAEAAVILSNPVIEEDSSMEAGQKVTWNCLWFGEYPQTEIVDQASSSGCYGKEWSTDSDYVVNASLYKALQEATYNSDGDVTIGNTKYHRIKKIDATYGVGGDSAYYNWTDSNTYHYFRYDPIKWRVLSVNGDEAILLADKALDDQKYNISNANVTWETSTIRSWLNGYGSSSNSCGIDYSSKNFIDRAFSSSEQNVIVSTTVVNDNNISYNTNGGNNTDDKIYLLSEAEVYNTDTAKSYGFVTDFSTDDEARRSKSSTFAKAMGIYNPTSYLGNCWWSLRSPGLSPGNAVDVYDSGYVDNLGYDIGDYDNGKDGLIGCRPALHLNLTSNNLWNYAGTVCSDGTVNEEAAPHVHSWDAGVITKQPTTSEEGVKTYTCMVCGAIKTESIEKLPPADSSATTQATQPTQTTQATVVVPGTTLKSVKNVKTRKLTIKWQKNTNVNGYLIQMSTKKNFTSGVIQKMVYNNQKVSLKSSKLKKKKTYYVRVCTYMVVNGQTYYSNWSNVKKVKIKK